MTAPNLRPRLPELDARAATRAALAGVALSSVAVILAVVTLVGLVLLNGRKADRASEDAKAAQRQAQLIVCALTNAQRSGNPRRPAPTSDLGAYSGAAWQAAYDGFACARFSADELDAVVRAVQTPKSTPRPSPTG